MTYETLTQMVVPRSATKIAEDDEYVLYTTTLFQRVVDEFTQKARDLKCVCISLQVFEQTLTKITPAHQVHCPRL